jgi:FkbM family methyltransferase
VIAKHPTHPLWYRPGTADEKVIADVWDREQYSLRDLPLQPYPVLNIIDAGAHIGAASRWFLQEFPGATVAGIEPDLENHRILAKNLYGHRACVVLAAVGGTVGRANVVDPGEGTWGYRTERSDGGFLDVVTLNVALPVQIVKIDVEGAEADIFTGDMTWVDQVPIIMIELHDWMLQGSGDGFRDCVASRHRRCRRRQFNRGEVTVSVREDWLL